MTPVIFLLIAGILIVLAQWAVLNSRGDSFKTGGQAPKTYRVITPMRYDDRESAEKLRIMVGESVSGVSVRDVSAKDRLMRRLEALGDLKDIQAAKSSEYLSVFPEGLIAAFLKLSDERKTQILNSAYTAGVAYLERLAREKVFTSNFHLMNSILWDEISKSNIPADNANLVYQILAGFGNLNIRYDDDLTQTARQAAVDEVPTIDRRLDTGDVIISKGEIVTKQTAELLRLQGYTEDVFPIGEIFAVILCVMSLPLWMGILCRGAGEHNRLGAVSSS